MANPSADYPLALHTSVDVSANASQALGATTPTHTDLEGKQEQEIVELQKKLGIGVSTAALASEGMVLRKNGDGETEWAFIVPAGDDQQIQFNDGGVFGTDEALYFEKATKLLTVSGGGIQAFSDGSQKAIVINQGGNANAFEVVYSGTTADAFNFYSNSIRSGGTLFNINDDNAGSSASVMNISSDGAGAAFNITAAGIAFRTSAGSVIFNENGGNHDLRAEGDTDENLLFLDASTDRIGVGTNAPATKLHLIATTPEFRFGTDTTNYGIISKSSGAVRVRDISATGGSLIDFDPMPSDGTGAAAFRFFRSTSTSGNTSFSVYVGDGTATLQHFFNAKGNSSVVTDSGNFGVGVGSPQAKLDVGGSVIINDSGADADVRIEGDTDANLLFTDASTDRVGIGTNTPSYKLDVAVPADSNNVVGRFFNNTDSANAQLIVENTKASNFWSIAAHILFRDGGADRFQIMHRYRNSGGTIISTTFLNAMEAAGIIQFQANSIERLSIKTTETVFNETGLDTDIRFEGDADPNLLFLDASTDRVGIGFVTPGAKLHVEEANGAGDVGIIIQNNATTANETASLYFNTTTGATTADAGLVLRSTRIDANSITFLIRTRVGGAVQDRFAISASEVVVNDSQLDSDFRVEGDTEANLLMVDASTDRVGIGTATPGNKLDVVGTIQADGLRLDLTPTLEGISPTHSVTISINGTNYKVPIVAA